MKNRPIPIHCHGCGRWVWAADGRTCPRCTFVNCHATRYWHRRIAYPTRHPVMPVAICECGAQEDLFSMPEEIAPPPRRTFPPIR